MRDARRFLKSGGGGGRFVRKDELRDSGPQRFVVREVLEEERAFDGQPATIAPVLVSTEGRKVSLRAQANLDRMIRSFGHDADTWPGRTIELFFDPAVRNPSGGEPGGIRIRVPDTAARVDSYVSDLDERKPAARRSKAKPKAGEDVPF